MFVQRFPRNATRGGDGGVHRGCAGEREGQCFKEAGERGRVFGRRAFGDFVQEGDLCAVQTGSLAQAV